MGLFYSMDIKMLYKLIVDIVYINNILLWISSICIEM